jgi:hypothetical protein
MQKGGLIKKDRNITNFDAFMNMINMERVEITKISFNSLYGFIFKLHVPQMEECEHQFYGLNENKTDFDAPIDALVIKMSVLNESKSDFLQGLFLDDTKIDKQCDILDNFKNEAIIQSKIYSDSLLYGDPLCPCLLDLFIFEYNTQIKNFLGAVLSKCKDDASIAVINWMFTLFNQFNQSQYKLGVIVMESAVEYSTFLVCYDAIFEGPEEKKKTEIAKLVTTLLTKLIRLYNECRILHFDLHMGNSLVKKNDDESFSLYIIDFGRFNNTGNATVINTFNVQEIDKILQFFITSEIKYKHKRFGIDISTIKEYYDVLKNYASIDELVNSLNTFYSLRTHKYKALMNGDFTQKLVKTDPFQCGNPLLSDNNKRFGIRIPRPKGGKSYKRKYLKSSRKRRTIRRKSIKRR